MRYCSKCGSEVMKGTNFCTECGTPVKIAKKDSKLQIKKLIIVLMLIVFCGAVVLKVVEGVGTPAYEKPLKTQIEATNKNDVKKFLKTFTKVGREYYKDFYTKESFENITILSYEAEDSGEGISYGMEDLLRNWTVDEYGRKLSGAMRLRVKLQYEASGGENGEEEVIVDVIKMNGKWYAINSILDQEGVQ